MRKFALIAALIAALATVVATSAIASDEQGGEDCVTVIDVPEQVIEHAAVTHEITVIDVEAVAGFWANFQPNDSQATFIGPPSYPSDERGSWITHEVGGPGQDESGVYAVGNPAKGGNWFYRQQAVAEVSHTETVVDEEAYTEVIPAVTHEECGEVTDVCANIEGVQDEVPAGFVLGEDGECILESGSDDGDDDDGGSSSTPPVVVTPEVGSKAPSSGELPHTL